MRAGSLIYSVYSSLISRLEPTMLLPFSFFFSFSFLWNLFANLRFLNDVILNPITAISIIIVWYWSYTKIIAIFFFWKLWARIALKAN